MRRAVAIGLAAAALVCASVTSGGKPAGAHALLERSDPHNGAVVDRAPQQVVLHFSEPVEVSVGALRVFDGRGRRVDAARPTHPHHDARAVALALPPLGDGGYVVTWRVLSADSHPVHGAFTFRVGAAVAGRGDGAEDLTRSMLAARSGNRATGVVYGVDRFLVFLAVLVLVGGAALVEMAWPDDAERGPVRTLLLVAAGVALLATLVSIGLQGAYAGGRPLSAAADPSAWRSTFDTRFGRAALWRVPALALAVAVALAIVGHRGPAGVRRAVGTLVGLSVLWTVGRTGHAVSGVRPVLGQVLDVAHLAAASAWLGGLVVVVSCVLPGDRRWARPVVRRFSTIALPAVALLVLTGSAQAWRQSGGIDAITTTTYGTLVLVKLGLVGAISAAALLSRRAVRQVAEPGRLRRSVAAELVIAVAVLAVTAVLVETIPARSAVARPFAGEAAAGPVLVDVTIEPARVGPVDVHVYVLTRSGQVRDVDELSATLRPDAGGEAVTVPLSRAGPGHFSAYGVPVPDRGRWRIVVRVRIGDVDEYTAELWFRIR